MDFETYKKSQFSEILNSEEFSNGELLIQSTPEEFDFDIFNKKIPEVRRGGLTIFVDNTDGITTFHLLNSIHPGIGDFVVNVAWKVNSYENLQLFADKVIKSIVFGGILKHMQLVVRDEDSENSEDNWISFERTSLRGVLVKLVQIAMSESMDQFEEEISDSMLDKICREIE